MSIETLVMQISVCVFRDNRVCNTGKQWLWFEWSGVETEHMKIDHTWHVHGTYSNHIIIHAGLWGKNMPPCVGISLLP